ncbi:putative deoxyribonuclease TATDN2 isoform 2-T3 [Leptodactylus fuscus]
MADRSASASRKHRGLSPPGGSPHKYLRSSESRRVSHSRDGDTRDSPSPAQDRQVTFYSRESAPRQRLDISVSVRSTVRARNRQQDGRQCDSADMETSEEAPQEETNHKEERTKDNVRRSSSDAVRRRSSSGIMPTLLFQRAFSDILGTPCRPRRLLDGATGRAQEEKQLEKKSFSDPEESPMIRPKPKVTQSEKEAERGRKVRSEEVTRDSSPRRTVSSMVTVSPSPSRTVSNVITSSPSSRRTVSSVIASTPNTRRTVSNRINRTPSPKRTVSSRITRSPSPKQPVSSVITSTPNTRRTVSNRINRTPSPKRTVSSRSNRTPSPRRTVSSRITRSPSPKQPVSSVITSTPKQRQTVSSRSNRTPSPRQPVSSVVTKPEASDPQEPPQLVFLDEDYVKDVNTITDLADKDPSIGSDFSDVEDMVPLARFSQDDEFSPCCSIQSDTKPSSYQSENSWSRYIEPRAGSPMYRPSPDHNTWRQRDLDNTCRSEPSLLDSSCESPPGHRHSPATAFGPSWIFGNTTRSSRRTSEILPSTSTDYKYQDGGFIDTHCHLDMLFARLSHRGSFADLREQYYSTFPREFHGCITDYCDPRTLPRLPWQQVLNEDLVWGAFGCHPHFAQYYNTYQHEDMMKALQHPKAIAFGEMGLDCSHKCSTSMPDQISVFEKQLKLVVPLGKPLVIHCRGADEDLFRIMKKWLPRDYKIHRHCFTGKYEDIEPFLKEFPNMAVGFTAVLTYPSAVEARDAVSRIPLDRLIVETDAPFFVPKQVPKRICKFAHPGLAIHTIHEIARLQNLPVRTVMSKLRENTYRIYSV